MTRDADIARIAAALTDGQRAFRIVGGAWHGNNARDLAAALYDAGLRLLADTPSVEPGVHYPACNEFCWGDTHYLRGSEGVEGEQIRDALPTQASDSPEKPEGGRP